MLYSIMLFRIRELLPQLTPRYLLSKVPNFLDLPLKLSQLLASKKNLLHAPTQMRILHFVY